MWATVLCFEVLLFAVLFDVVEGFAEPLRVEVVFADADADDGDLELELLWRCLEVL